MVCEWPLQILSREGMDWAQPFLLRRIRFPPLVLIELSLLRKMCVSVHPPSWLLASVSVTTGRQKQVLCTSSFKLLHDIMHMHHMHFMWGREATDHTTKEAELSLALVCGQDCLFQI